MHPFCKYDRYVLACLCNAQLPLVVISKDYTELQVPGVVYDTFLPQSTGCSSKSCTCEHCLVRRAYAFPVLQVANLQTFKNNI